ncbi:class I SAM-dependent methyltransferase [Mesobacillus campisalis]|uniref:class I SAM-dependent methyltransferase n=1 Tax=Mesobacillus campisalis TaxID=1408103 RepID=UPI000699A78B|nr:methyltransferase domain-containing protein [Mesobacillus campisalis]
MKKPLDRISEAYFGELGDEFAEKVRSRIHWICENAKGESILDVGCSQGITSIILGREGKTVLGIDLIEDAINYANHMLSKEERPTRECVKFKSANFMSFNFENQLFDTIIFGEVLEHLTDPQRFLNKAETLLNKNGSIIITLPFGINNYFDHKKTYYLMDILKLQGENLVIQEVKFLGKWIGITLKKREKDTNPLNISHDLLSRLENAFYQIEKDLVANIDTFKNTAISSEQNDKIEAEIDNLKILLLNKDNEIKGLLESLENREKEILSLKNNNITIKDLNEAQRLALIEKKEKIKVQEELLKSYEKEERLLHSHLNLLELENELVIAKKEKVKVQEELLKSYEKEEHLLKAYQKLLKKYSSLSESKLGKITLAYWRKRSGKKRKVGGKLR